ncbi:MAG TPA: helix-turn-helix transcriptional regulator [Thermoanaerobaculia bacterium]|nr:helix-turn-helix transcriptional regulator [Thermoanaerobaculia bacterium]
MNITPEIGGALRTARQARRLSLSDVSAKAGLSVATLSRIETGKQNFDVTLLLTIAAILHINPSELLDANSGGKHSPSALAEELAMLSAAERAKVVATALKQARQDGSREALHVRVESLLTTLDLIREELLQVRRDMRRGR